ncbi:flippase-like domain-containing protein [Thermosulfurimonas marina]|uniref:Flippase-like domain-containing protein n=1 Tax=Thermosulfurimonas marina TaxID=2047767 RepID=A0A6H1WUD9_9BACT|nr:lysylphosphatidylglycerol synthase transmembrane domain-containing protein [Thermosulfurimonas marina]QJA06791.1 flippase-like domain-containing protein [Thermosulfurimonas marina]
MKKWTSFLLRVGVSTGLLVYLLRRVEVSSLAAALRAYSPLWWLAGFIVYAAFQALSTLRWQTICSHLGLRQSYGFFLKLYLVNMYFNTLLPGLMGGDVVRSYYLYREGLRARESGVSVILDRGAGLAGLCFILLLALPRWGDFLPLHLRRTLFLWAAAVVAGGMGLTLWATLSSRRAPYLEPLRLPQAGKIFLYGLGVQLLYVLQFVVMARGLAVEMPASDFLVLVPVTGFLASLPVSLGGLGVREASLVYFMSLRGVPQEKALLLGLLVYSTVLVGALPGAYLYLRGLGRVRT